MKPPKEIPVRIGELLVAYVYYLGPGQWFVATVNNSWEPPRYAKRICDF